MTDLIRREFRMIQQELRDIQLAARQLARLERLREAEGVTLLEEVSV